MKIIIRSNNNPKCSTGTNQYRLGVLFMSWLSFTLSVMALMAGVRENNLDLALLAFVLFFLFVLIWGMGYIHILLLEIRAVVDVTVMDEKKGESHD